MTSLSSAPRSDAPDSPLGIFVDACSARDPRFVQVIEGTRDADGFFPLFEETKIRVGGEEKQVVRLEMGSDRDRMREALRAAGLTIIAVDGTTRRQ